MNEYWLLEGNSEENFKRSSLDIVNVLLKVEFDDLQQRFFFMVSD